MCTLTVQYDQAEHCMAQALFDAGRFIAGSLLYLCILFILLRFIVQALSADFYNPLTQAIVRVTNPILAPLRKILVLPGARRLDYAALLMGLVFTMLLLWIRGVPAERFVIDWAPVLAFASFELLATFLDIYFYIFLVLIIASWLAPTSAHPGIRLIHQITEPIIAPVRRLIPPAGGLDFSVLIIILILLALRHHILPGLMATFATFP